MPPSSQSIAHSTRAFVASNWGAFWRGLWLPLFLMLFAGLLIGQRVVCLLAGSTALRGSDDVELVAWLLLLADIVLFLLAMMQSFAWRLVMAPAPVSGIVHFRVDADVWRLVESGFKRGVIAVLTAVVTFIVGCLAVSWIESLVHRHSLMAILPIPIVALLIVGYVDARLSMSGPDAIRSGTLRLSDSWRTTRHRVGWLRRVGLRLMLPSVLVESLLLVAFAAWLFSLPGFQALATQFTALPLGAACAALWKVAGLQLLLLMVLSYAVALVFSAITLAGWAIASNSLIDAETAST